MNMSPEIIATYISIAVSLIGFGVVFAKKLSEAGAELMPKSLSLSLSLSLSS